MKLGLKYTDGQTPLDEEEKMDLTTTIHQINPK